MKIKAKSFTHTHTRACAYTRTSTLPLRPVSGADLFRKAKRGLSVSFTLEIKWTFKWRPLTRGHICPVTNFTPPSSPDDSPVWPHPGNLWPTFAWTERGVGMVFRPTEITCLHWRCQRLITIAVKGERTFVSSFSAYIHYKRAPAPKIFTLGPNRPGWSVLTCTAVITTALVPPFTGYSLSTGLCSVSIHAPSWPVWLLLTCTQLSGGVIRFI